MICPMGGDCERGCAGRCPRVIRPPILDVETYRPAVHFVGFRDDRYWAAVRVWGLPDFVHSRWDQRAHREVAPGDTVVFAREYPDGPTIHSGADYVEVGDPAYREQFGKNRPRRGVLR